MDKNSADQFFPRTARSTSRRTNGPRRRSTRARTPSSKSYLFGAVVVAATLFIGLWWILVSGGDEAPWVAAGLAASVVLLVALSAREVVMRRAWTRYLLDQDGREHLGHEAGSQSKRPAKSFSSSFHSSTLRALQQRSAELDSPGASYESHLELFNLCQDYVASTEDALRSNGLSAEQRITLRAGQERVKTLQKHHLLTWARDASRAMTREAQQRARITDKIETANRALECLDRALKYFPDDPEVNASKVAVREFIASVKVAHWVELAERSAFKGHYRRAILRYQDALFYLLRESVKDEVKIAGADRIGREIRILRARLLASVESEGPKGGERKVGGNNR